MTPAEPPVAVVTGGSRGLGQHIVESFLARGYRVSTSSRTQTDFTSQMLQDHPDRFHWTEVDLEQGDAAKSLVRSVVARFGRIDVLVNNAGYLHQELLLTTPRRQVDSLVAVNLVAPILVAQACARAMTVSGGGRILNVSSINAVRGHRGVSVYSAAKAGLDGFTRSLARELGPMNILVNSVVPGYFDSDMTSGVTPENRTRIERRTPLRRLGTVQEVVAVVDFLASPAASFITGQTLVIDGGLTC